MKVSDLNEGKMLPVSEGQGARTGDRCFQSVNGLMCLHQQVGSWNQGAGRRRDLRAERQPFTHTERLGLGKPQSKRETVKAGQWRSSDS